MARSPSASQTALPRNVRILPKPEFQWEDYYALLEHDARKNVKDVVRWFVLPLEEVQWTVRAGQLVHLEPRHGSPQQSVVWRAEKRGRSVRFTSLAAKDDRPLAANDVTVKGVVVGRQVIYHRELRTDSCR